MNVRKFTTSIAVCAALGYPATLIGATLPDLIEDAREGRHADTDIRHVLLISIDGLHESDLDKLKTALPGSTLEYLMDHGVAYEHASCTTPSDSQPGILALTTGGTPKSTGCFYDNSWDRTLFAPGSSTPGVNALYDENVEFDSSLLDGGGGIDSAHLPVDAHGNPVFPHSYLRVNTIFEVIKAAGMRTAWCDKSWGYEILNGPSGHGIDDLYVPEIKSHPVGSPAGLDFTSTIPLCESYDDLKVAAVINQIDGLDHAGSAVPGHRVPAIFGMNFQAISVGQKLPVGGYQGGVPGNPMTANLLDAFHHTDESIGRMVAELKKRHLFESTLIVISAKHGQAPIDPGKVRKLGSDIIPTIVGTSRAAHITLDDVALIWLTPDAQKDTEAVVDDLQIPANMAAAGIKRIIWGTEMTKLFGNPKHNSRTPDIIVVPEEGVIYTGSKKKNAEHGGFNEDDTHVGMIVANPRLIPGSVKNQVHTTQVAPTILWSLGLEAGALKAVREEGTPALPGLRFKHDDDDHHEPHADG